MEVWGLVLAAGSGARFGGVKQFAALGNQRLVDLSVRAAASTCDKIVVVLPPGRPWDGPRVTAAVEGGATRSASVRAGLAAVPSSADVVVVHDAAHPLATPELLHAVIAAVQGGADGAVPGVPLSDTVKRVRDGVVVETIPADGLVAAPTPHAFRAAILRAAHADAPEAADDTLLLERIGGKIAVVPGDPRNVHITTPADLDVAARLLPSS